MQNHPVHITEHAWEIPPGESQNVSQPHQRCIDSSKNVVESEDIQKTSAPPCE